MDVWVSPPIATTSKKKYYPTGTGSQISWVCDLKGTGLGLCDADRNEFRVWRTTTKSSGNNNNNRDDISIKNVPLAPLGNPVGAFQSKIEPNLVYVACFGTFEVPQNDSGVAIVDISDADNPFLVGTYAYPHPHHVHNIYEFDFFTTTPEVIVAILGNPWMDPPVPGHGLVKFDRITGQFVTLSSSRLNVRSATQVSPGIFYALTQEPEGVPTKLVRIEQQEQQLIVKATMVLPPRNGGDGGADVLLGIEPNTLWVSDRWKGPGRLHYYSYNETAATTTTSNNLPDPFFDLLATHVATGGVNARYTVLTQSGDMLVCNQDSNTLTVMHGLALSPMKSTSSTKISSIETVGSVQFYIENNHLPSYFDDDTNDRTGDNISATIFSQSSSSSVSLFVVAIIVSFIMLIVTIVVYKKQRSQYRKI